MYGNKSRPVILVESKGTAVTSQSLTSPTESKMVAHRGYSYATPENSIPSFELAGKLGFWGAETDVKCTSDGQWILMHDSTVDRTTDGTGTVEQLTLSYIQSLTIDAGNNISKYQSLKVPTFDEYLRVCKKHSLVPIIEVKSGVSDSNMQTLLNSIYQNGLDGSCSIMSFTLSTLEQIRSLNKNINLQYLTDNEISQTEIDTVKGIGFCDLSTSAPTESGILLAHQNDVKVNCWTINDMANAITYRSWGVDSITTDKISEVHV